MRSLYQSGFDGETSSDIDFVYHACSLPGGYTIPIISKSFTPIHILTTINFIRKVAGYLPVWVPVKPIKQLETQPIKILSQ